VGASAPRTALWEGVGTEGFRQQRRIGRGALELGLNYGDRLGRRFEMGRARERCIWLWSGIVRRGKRAAGVQ
jgi:hypothetical protein